MKNCFKIRNWTPEYFLFVLKPKKLLILTYPILRFWNSVMILLCSLQSSVLFSRNKLASSLYVWHLLWMVPRICSLFCKQWWKVEKKANFNVPAHDLFLFLIQIIFYKLMFELPYFISIWSTSFSYLER